MKVYQKTQFLSKQAGSLNVRMSRMQHSVNSPLTHDKQTGSLVDRAGNAWVVFDKVSNIWESSASSE
jgi:hypothetical protein